MKEKRDRLFKGGRPNIRPLIISEGDRYSRDLGILWAAHNRVPFYDFPKDLSRENFAKSVEDISKIRELLIIDDYSKEYTSGNGPIAVFFISGDGWRIEPHTVIFPWATARNKLRCAVAFLQMARYKKIGVCLIKSIKESKPLFDKCIEYGVLHYVGRIINGDPRGDEYLYSVRGKLNVRT